MLYYLAIWKQIVPVELKIDKTTTISRSVKFPASSSSSAVSATTWG